MSTENTLICEKCKKEFKNKYTWKAHVETSKKCGKNNEEDKKVKDVKDVKDIKDVKKSPEKKESPKDDKISLPERKKKELPDPHSVMPRVLPDEPLDLACPFAARDEAEFREHNKTCLVYNLNIQKEEYEAKIKFYLDRLNFYEQRMMSQHDMMKKMELVINHLANRMQQHGVPLDSDDEEETKSE